MTPSGDYWLGTFMYGLDDTELWKDGTDILSTYRLMRETALRFQTELAQRFLGKNVLRAVRSVIYESGPSDERVPVWHMLHRALLKYITYFDRDMRAVCPDEHVLWHYAQPILLELRSCDSLYPMWEAEMGEKFRVRPFKNTVKGGFFF